MTAGPLLYDRPLIFALLPGIPKPMEIPENYDLAEVDSQWAFYVKEIVYMAIYVHPGEPKPKPEILNSKDLTKYHTGWGKPGDFGLLLIDKANGQPVGGAFVRYFTKETAGYGFVSSDYPEMDIALLPEHRSKGLGTFLLQQLIDRLRKKGCLGVSLSVDKRNPGIGLYRKFGFRQVRDDGNPVLLLHFS